MSRIAEKFQSFCNNLRMHSSVTDAIQLRYHYITRRLNIEYYGTEDDVSHSLYVGSYGRGTDIHVSDVDMIFWLPYDDYLRFNKYDGNGQSAMLAEVRTKLQKTYSTSHLRADGQVIQIAFDDGVQFEIVPAFENKDDSFTYPDSNDGGSWKVTRPREEIAAIISQDRDANYNLRRLCRMVRAWKDEKNVPMGGLLIDTLAADFMKSWAYRDKSYLYYDYMTRDFFLYLSKVNDEQAFWYAVGSNQLIYPRGPFSYKAKCAYNRALEALEYESKEYEWSANQKWKEIYGSKFTG